MWYRIIRPLRPLSASKSPISRAVQKERRRQEWWEMQRFEGITVRVMSDHKYAIQATDEETIYTSVGDRTYVPPIFEPQFDRRALEIQPAS